MLRRAAALALLIATACSSGPLPPPQPAAEPAAPSDVSAPREGHLEFTIKVRLQMVISGATELGPIETDAELRVVEIMGGRNPKEIWFYSVSPARPVELGKDRLMLFSADLAPGIYGGPGRYTLSEASGVSIGGQQGLGSGAYVQLYLRGGPDVPKERVIKAFRRYDRFGQPCTLEVVPDSLTGSVSCPELRNEEDESVALHWNWARI